MAAPKDLYTAALWGGSVRRYGDMVQLTMPGIGVVTTQQDMQQATSWARSKMASGAINKDRMQLMDRLETLIARQYRAVLRAGAIEPLPVWPRSWLQPAWTWSPGRYRRR